MRVAATAAALVLLFHAAPLRAQSAGTLTGCIVDTTSQPLPGVTVSAWASAREFSALTDEQGCYVLEPLPPNRYTVVARLQGFNTATREVRVEAGIVQRINLWLKIGAICECVAIPETPRGLWERSVAVVHVRIEHEIAGPRDMVLSAAALEVFKRHPDGAPADDRLTFLIRLVAAQATGRPKVYAPGGEFLLFFADWYPESQLFRLHDDGPMAVPIDRTRGLAVLFGKEVAFNTLLAQLRAWARAG